MHFKRLAIALAVLAGLAAAASATTVTITRDRWGVPHIFIPPTVGNRAKQLRALGFAQGYATAQDRMVQLEFFRRAGKGRLSEIPFLASFLAMDIATRRDGLTDDERRDAIGHLPGKVRLAFKAFADGVNRFLQEIAADPSRRPGEFVLLNITPEPWDVTDTAAIAELEVRRFGQNGGDELRNASLLLDLLDAFPPAEARGIFTDLFWLEDPTAPTTIDPAEQTFTPDPVTPFAARQMALLSTYTTEIRNAAMALAGEQTMLASLGPQVGFPFAFPATASNSIVVSSALTASGHPIVLGGPQTGLNLPSFFYEIGLHGGGYDAEGVTVPAGAGLVIGRTANAAWSLTSGITDNTDVYVEQLNPSNSKQYRFDGVYRDMECRMETFNVQPTPQTYEFCRTIHGPVFASFPRVAFSKRLYFFGREVKAASSLVSLGFARNLKKFERTIDKLEASLNCMYGDNAGNIAYFHRGVRPRRPADVDPRLPLPGDGSAEVRNILEGRKMPTAVNPPLGFIAQWNNKPIKGWSADDQRELWGGADRVQILIDQLEAAKMAGHPITPADVTAYMKVAATVDQFAPRVFPYLRAAVDALPPATADLSRLDMAADLIGIWLSSGGVLLADGSGNIPYPGVTIYREWRQQVQSDTFGDELGSHTRAMSYFQTSTGNNEDDAGSLFSPDALFLRALAYPSGPFPTSRDYFANVSTATNPGRDATLVDALRTALTTLENRYGTMDMTQWLTPKITVEFDDSASASGFAYGPTVIERENRGTINEVIDLGPTPMGQIIVPPGNSGHIPASINPEPPHLRDQVAPYEAFQFHSMPFAPADLEGPTTTQTLPLP